jgi:hypothetical protein
VEESLQGRMSEDATMAESDAEDISGSADLHRLAGHAAADMHSVSHRAHRHTACDENYMLQ